MKKFHSFILIIIGIILFSNVNADATCPVGSTQTFRNFWINGCEYRVEICYQCFVTQPNNVEIFGFAKIDPSCDPGLNVNQVYEELTSRVHNPIFLNELCGLPGPCDQYPGGMWWTFAEDMCWQKEKVLYNNQEIITYYPCNLVNVICHENHRICFDPITGTFVDILMQGPEIAGNFNCAGMNEPPDPINLNQPSACFFLVTPCYP